MENENMEVETPITEENNTPTVEEPVTPVVEENTTPTEEQTPKKGKNKLLIILLIVIVVGMIAALVLPSLLKKEETKEEPKQEEKKEEEQEEEQEETEEETEETTEETTDDDSEEETTDEEDTEDPNAPYDFSSDINCTNKKDIAIPDIFNFDETEEGISYTEQLLKVGTYTPDKLSPEVTSYYLSNSQYACEYIKYNEAAKASSKEGTLLATITEDDMKKAVEKLYGPGKYKRSEDGYSLGLPNSCNTFDYSPKANSYELSIIGGCGGASSETIKVTKKDVTTSGENTIVTEYIDYSGLDEKDKIVKYKLKVEYTVRTTDKVLIKIVTTKI